MFAEEQTRPVLAEVCHLVGRSAARARLIRHHTNAVYAVDDLVVKIAPAGVRPDRLRTVVTVVDWLTTLGFPTVTLWPGLPQPLEVGGHGVTIWQRLDPGSVTTAELGALLRRLHTLPEPPVQLPRLDPIAGIRRSVGSSTILTAADRDLLLNRLNILTGRWRDMRFPRGAGLIQSDPQIRNALRRPDGTAVLADWDGACIGPREWDIATVAVHCRRFGAAETFTDFVITYGWDPTTWDAFEDLCQLRELQMIATNARKSAPGSPAADEVHHRISGVRQEARELTAWQIL